VSIATKKKQRPGDLEELVRYYGQLTAWLHLRGSGRQGSAIADRLIDFADDSGWRQEIRDYAKAYAKQVDKDWQTFCAANKAGAFAAMLG
jgi:uncharacterized protein (DUF2252 family)